MGEVVLLMAVRGKAGVCLCLAFMLICPAGCGDGSRTALESDGIEIRFASFSDGGTDHPLGMFVLHNASDEAGRFVSATVSRDADSNEAISDLLRVTSRELLPGAWEYGVVQVNKKDVTDAMRLRVEYESAGKLYYCSRLVKPCDVWCKLMCADPDSGSLVMYAELPERMDKEPCCYVNGEEAARVATSQLETADGGQVLALRIEPRQPMKAGARVFTHFSLDDKSFGGVTKLFHPFVVGKTQYELVVRPVRVQHGEESTTITLYNEADFRKSPALLQRVCVNGVDVTEHTTFPRDALPPDLHHYEKDVRDLVVDVPLNVGSGRNRYEIEFKRQPPLRDQPTPAGYFDVQSFWFETQLGIPYSIGGWGLRSGVCSFYGGLRPRPELQEIIRRNSKIAEVDPLIPVFACTGTGTKVKTLRQLAGCGDFLIAGEPYGEKDSANRSDDYFCSLEQFRAIPVPWTASVLSGNPMGFTSPEDLQWQTWACLAMGSHGVLLTPPEKGDERMIADCEAETHNVLDGVQELGPLLGMACHVPLSVQCNQQGVRIEGGVCGPDNLLLCAFNEWSSRTGFQGHERFMAANRLGVQIDLRLGEDWESISVVDPLSGHAISSKRQGEGVVSILLPSFNNVQPVLISRNTFDAASPLADEKEESRPPYQFESSPVVNLGPIRTDSEHEVTVGLKSFSEKELRFRCVDASHKKSLSGSFAVREFVLRPQCSAELRIPYTAPSSAGDSVTHIRFDCAELPNDSFDVYLCADLQQPVTISPSLVDFGLCEINSSSESRTVRVSSENERMRILKIDSRSPVATELETAPDGQSFSFCVLPTELGVFSFVVDVSILIEGDQQPIRRTVTVRGDARNSVFAAPPQVSVLLRDKAQHYKLRVRHIAGETIQIETVTHDASIHSRVKSEGFLVEHEVGLTITPDVASTGSCVVAIRGRTESQAEFTLTVPVSIISLDSGQEDGR